MNHLIEITETKKWIKDIVIANNFCPFAAKVFNDKTIHYQIAVTNDFEKALDEFLAQLNHLKNTPTIETALIIFPESFTDFEDFLDLAEAAEEIIEEHKFEGIFQVATFHPNYQFADTEPSDPENYTNKSIYPMLHILREDSIEKVLQFYENPENIPINNIKFAKEKGAAYFKILLDNCS